MVMANERSLRVGDHDRSAAGEAAVVESLRHDPVLVAIILGALAVRVGVAVWPVFSYPDELWQYLEPARHIAVGRWIETWDFRDGLRSWLLPTMLSGPMALGYAMAPLTRLDVLFARLLAVAVSMGALAAAMAVARTISCQHAAVVGIAMATWFEVAYLAPRTLAEPIAAGLALLAVFPLLLRRSLGAMVIAGALLALACAIRFQYFPALAVLAAGVLRFDWPRWRGVALGGLIGLSISASADAAMGAVPFRWIGRNIVVNLLQGKAASFGVQPPWWYATESWQLNGPGCVVLTALALIGARRYPVLFLSALTNLVVHSLIAHKEERFVFYSLSIVIVLAAIGSVDVWNGAMQRLPRRFGVSGRGSAVLWLGLGWVGWSVTSAASGSAASTWGVYGRAVGAWKHAGEVPDNCGTGIYAIQDVPFASQALLSRDVPIFQYGEGERAAALRSRAYNVALTTRRLGAELRGFSLVSCDRLDYFCVFRRPGGCHATSADASHDANAFLIRRGK